MTQNLAYRYLQKNKDDIKHELRKMIERKNMYPISIINHSKSNIILSVIVVDNIYNIIKINEIKKEIYNYNIDVEWDLINETLLLLKFIKK